MRSSESRSHFSFSPHDWEWDLCGPIRVESSIQQSAALTRASGVVLSFPMAHCCPTQLPLTSAGWKTLTTETPSSHRHSMHNWEGIRIWGGTEQCWEDQTSRSKRARKKSVTVCRTVGNNSDFCHQRVSTLSCFCPYVEMNAYWHSDTGWKVILVE